MGATGRGHRARGAKPKKIDSLSQASPMHPHTIDSLRASRSRAAARAPAGVTKQRRSTRARVDRDYMEYDEGDNDEEENPDDEYEQYPIHVARPDGTNITVPEDFNIDPALVQTNTDTDLGYIDDDFDLQIQYSW